MGKPSPKVLIRSYMNKKQYCNRKAWMILIPLSWPSGHCAMHFMSIVSSAVPFLYFSFDLYCNFLFNMSFLIMRCDLLVVGYQGSFATIGAKCA